MIFWIKLHSLAALQAFIFAKVKSSQNKDSIFKSSSGEKHCNRSIFCAIFSKHTELKINAVKTIWPVKWLETKHDAKNCASMIWSEVSFSVFFDVVLSFSFCSVHFLFTSTNRRRESFICLINRKGEVGGGFAKSTSLSQMSIRTIEGK